VLGHPALVHAPPQQSRLLRSAALFRFLNFTHKLELLVVNTVTANIALGRYDFVLAPDMRRHAHRIYVDEGYHALFSFEHMEAMRSFLPHDMAVERKPQFLLALDSMRAGLGDHRVLLLELFFVVFSEMLITSTLKTAHAQDGLDGGVRELLAQHSQDEARHHVFYKALLHDIWPQLGAGDQDFLLEHTPSLLLSYCSPDTPTMAAELTCLGFSGGEAQQILADTYPHRATANYAQQIGQGIFASLDRVVCERQREILGQAARTQMMTTARPAELEQSHV